MLSVLTHKKRNLKQVNKTHFSTVDRNNNKTRKLHHMDKIPVIQFQVGQRQSTCRSKKPLQLSNCRQSEEKSFCGYQDKELITRNKKGSVDIKTKNLSLGRKSFCGCQDKELVTQKKKNCVVLFLQVCLTYCGCHYKVLVTQKKLL